MSALPRLHAITDDARLADARFLDDAAALLEAGGSDVALHLRGRGTTAARLHELALALQPVARASGAKLLVNDRVDVALVAHMDGVQLREDSLDARIARRLLGAHALIGVSRHAATIETEAEADFVVFGAVYATASHPGHAAAGLAALRDVASKRRPSRALGQQASERAVPLIAIGGITAERVAEVLAAGAYGVAAIRGIWERAGEAAGIGERVEEYLGRLRGHADHEA